MKRILFSVVFCGAAMIASAQCQPDYDFGTAVFGVSPDPQLGETFDTGYVDMPYADIIHMLVPIEAGDVDPAFEGFGTIDSLRLESVTVTIADVDVDISVIGLGFTCNNNGDSPDPCTFMGGSQYCADLTGVPTQAGVFPTKINVTGYIASFLGTISVPYTFENYSIVVEGEQGVGINQPLEISLGQNVPNPSSGRTEIQFELSRSMEVHFAVSNLLGEEVSSQLIQGRRGSNVLYFDSSEIQQGIYLYSIEVGDKKFTRRMIIQ